MNTLNIPKDWDQATHLLWLDNLKQQAIERMVNVLNQSKHQKEKSHFLQLGYYLFFSRDFKSATNVLSTALTHYPNDCEILTNLAVSFNKCNDHQRAISCLEKVVEIDSKNFLAFDGLAEAYFRIGLLEKSSAAGKKSLILKDKKFGSSPIDLSFPKISIEKFTKRKRKVISFSLWGKEKKYLYGALRNVLLAPDIFPDWEVWFYIDESVPMTFLSLIEELGAKLVWQPNQQTLKEKLCWRFQVANNDEIGYFIVRDTDSVIGIREQYAVQMWLESGKWFHIIRDWWTHTDLILAGLWGGIAEILPDIKILVKQYVPQSVETPNIDQLFLRDTLWAHIKKNVQIHDRFFNQVASSSTNRPLPHPDGPHIGCCEYYVARSYQEKFLRPWITGYDWGIP